MILPIKFLWSQLNGPQVTAITTAVFEYWKEVFDTKLDYFNTLSVNSANDAHLTLLGLLSGLIRPTITEADKEYFYFTEDLEHPNNQGFSDLEDLSSGGKLSKVGIGLGTHEAALDIEHYRALLNAWINGKGELGSLALLDDICDALTKIDLGSEVAPFYRFIFMNGDDIPEGRAAGDLYLNVGNLTNWHNPMHVHAVLRGVADSVYSPLPQVFISIGVTGRVSTPVFSVPGGIYEEAQEVEISCSSPSDVSIYYTTDGSTPTAESTPYTGPVTISETCTLRAVGMAPNYGNSEITKALYTIGG